MSRYAVVIEHAEGNLSAYVPDLPGCVSTGATPEEVEANIAEAIALHIESLRAHGEAVPAPSSTITLVDVAL